MKTLILGGTLDASRLAKAVSETQLDALFSYAGRVDVPREQPIPTRIGGFGGVAGLVDFILREQVRAVIDATHPFAAQMSRNAIAACAQTNTPLLALERPPWREQPDDNWINVADITKAVDALPETPARIFLGIGRQHLNSFYRKPQHHYLLRIVDQPGGPLDFPNYEIVVDRGPFEFEKDRNWLAEKRIQYVVAKNAGGEGAFAKIQAARDLKLQVIMIGRPALPKRNVVADPKDVLNWLAHSTSAI
ncbi:cobalt-precorrin-6A reductase [Sneathiella aquimaris]|uniref:cobalt-precorrin-6A reductase n=1 Tax=Sneathiella aquimaris TaxID=2599305 RepID=UPI00146DEE20|nr:cobalt-precorrin-6A reductase [Sneathiella aquimaris]